MELLSEQIVERGGKLYHQRQYTTLSFGICVAEEPISPEEAARLNAMWGGRDHYEY